MVIIAGNLPSFYLQLVEIESFTLQQFCDWFKKYTPRDSKYRKLTVQVCSCAVKVDGHIFNMVGLYIIGLAVLPETFVFSKYINIIVIMESRGINNAHILS